MTTQSKLIQIGKLAGKALYYMVVGFLALVGVITGFVVVGMVLLAFGIRCSPLF